MDEAKATNSHMGEDGKLHLPEELYNDMLAFFRRTSLPRIQRARAEQKALEQAQDDNNG